MPDRTEVTAGGIARLAGVGRAAVSNWRRRHADFPRPVGGTDTSPAFDAAEVEAWLLRRGKLTSIPLREQVGQLLLADPAGAAAALARAGAVLLLAQERPGEWSGPAAVRDGLGPAVAEVLAERLGPGHPVPVDGYAERLPLLRGAASLADELGPRQAYEFLLGRLPDTGPRAGAATPAGTAELMAALAGPAAAVLDPAAGTGALLRAAGAPDAVYAQESDPQAAALTALRLALHGPGRVRVHVGDSLRHDAFPGLAADAALCHPPFNERAWGHEELAYDPRWEYGLPARAESELAWVQHALARLRDGGVAVLLLPPAVASRRSGRRIRADLLRRGVLRAVVALPAGAAPPHAIPLHLWVLRRPSVGAAADPRLLVVDAGALPAGDGGRQPWQAVRSAVLDAWDAFEAGGAGAERPGVSRVLPVIGLLDDDVDLAPARHLPPPRDGGADGLAGVRDRLTAALLRTSELAPQAPPAGPARWPVTTVGQLARDGALVMRAGGGGTAPGGGGPRVLTEHDVVAGTAPSGTLPDGPAEEPVLVREGDVVVPVLGRGGVARVADAALDGAALGRGVHLLRCDPEALDPWFVAGFLRGSANTRQASSYTTAATRLDVRRLQLPRLPLGEQRRYSERFRTLAAFEAALRLAGELGGQLVRGLYDGLADGSVRPD
ncbi:N-6 DNA methylase [Streptomyces sp. NPDC001380]|uniref:N-6 DNA methylase n=1 Tax=Streptomyces sp. NPDC001380 TaxID=3364566 RepID=UPI003698ADC3